MQKGQIRRLQKELTKEQKEAETFFIEEAENNTEFYIQKYKELESSFNGNYICADLFKETFPKYTESIDTRKKYAEVVHNSAAVLSNELFHKKAKEEEIKKCIFLSGVPGAGKSFLIQSLFLTNAIEKDTMIYEGDISSPTIVEKMQTAVENNIDLYVLIVNPTLKLAQQNAISRSMEIGRGASSQTMARIMSGIPNALLNLKKQFPSIELGIYNKKTNYDIDYLVGFDNITILEHGSYEEILNELLEYREQILSQIEIESKKKQIDNLIIMESQEEETDEKQQKRIFEKNIKNRQNYGRTVKE